VKQPSLGKRGPDQRPDSELKHEVLQKIKTEDGEEVVPPKQSQSDASPVNSQESSDSDSGSGLSNITVTTEEFSTNDLIYGQYEDISRPKGHKCIFRDLVMHLNGTDYIVKKLTGTLSHQYKQS